MDLILDGKGALQDQLVRAMKTAIAQGRVLPGSRLPPSRALASDLGVSRNTVVRAYERLTSEGVLECRVGAGTFVVDVRSRMQRAQAGPTVVAAQSAYASRMRRFHDMKTVPYRKVEGTAVTFQSGVATVNPALTSVWGRELARAAEYALPEYPQPQGAERLREEISRYLARRRGVLVPPEAIVIVNGSQQALALVSRLLLDEGSDVVVENPHYFGMRESLQAHGANLLPVSVDRDGLVTDHLPVGSPRLVCVTPSHQFPSGAVLSQARRQALLDYARQRGAWVYEDDYDGEYRFGRPPLPALQSIDTDGRVIYVGTFSKVLFPSLRLAYVVPPPALREDLIRAKWLHDFGAPTIEQVALANFLANGGFERHLRVASKALASRRRTLLAALDGICRGRFHYLDCNAGVHLAVWLHDTSLDQLGRLIRKARALGVGLHSIEPCFLGEARPGLLLSYGATSEAEIRDGIALFGEALDARREWD